MKRIELGLYRHFKGQYYFLQNVARRDGDFYCYYFNAMHPEAGYYVRPYSEWDTDVSDRDDNYTGQIHRFEKIYDLDFQLGSVSTSQLITELNRREDSPLQELDIDGLNSEVFSRDVIVGEAYEATRDTPKGVFTVATFDTVKEAYDYMKSHSVKRNTHVFKRVFLPVDEEK